MNDRRTDDMYLSKKKKKKRQRYKRKLFCTIIKEEEKSRLEFKTQMNTYFHNLKTHRQKT